ncbi:hypothetical protein J5N97_019717 [Dioscorea zingiberensis]|uniref:Carboxypeptidase n=1 Tax=Dioscorea zingiberensis TaxID=325984 RepID=A0A9D5CEM2_9LILI|nr:hypothetical protein J5N97_019717 [Dioscorea zingiberensis]
MKPSPPLLFFACYLLFIAQVHGDNQGDRLLSLVKSKVTQRTKWNQEAMNALAEDDVDIDIDIDAVYLSRQDGLKEADKIHKLPGQPKGPGCSSLGAGAMSELGPFFVKRDGKTLYRNAHAWNNAANILFLESPAGVGFSYSNRTTDYAETGDRSTAKDAYTFLINWLERFPQYKTRDFFITGESYAGHYIPQLANLIIKNNRKKNNTIIKLKGIAIGNAYVSDNHNVKGVYEYYWSRSLISNETYNQVVLNCDFDNGNYSSECLDAKDLADEEHGQLDFYNIYAPLCSDSSSINSMGADPCSSNYIHSYLNLPEVQKALHANTTKLNYPWIDCSNLVGNDWTDWPDSVLPEIVRAINSKLRVWLYSGDVDSVVPVTATQYSLKALGLPIETKWRPWYLNQEVGGYFVGYKGLTFVTVRGSGHMVPGDQPGRALKLFKAFLEGENLPVSSSVKS